MQRSLVGSEMCIRDRVKRELAEKGNAKPGMGDIARLISQRWNALGEEEKRAFKEKLSLIHI